MASLGASGPVGRPPRPMGTTVTDPNLHLPANSSMPPGSAVSHVETAGRFGRLRFMETSTLVPGPNSDETALNPDAKQKNGLDSSAHGGKQE